MTHSSDAESCGTLYDDLDGVASRVHRITGEHPVVVWADHSGGVHAVVADQLPEVPAAWVAGTFDQSSTPEDIRDDLREVLRQRVRGVILE